jgi:Na+-transporting NADH:ubiquinone oxidoreductase subunit E
MGAPNISAWLILFAAIFTNNILLTNFLGMCSFLAVTSTVATATGLGIAVTFVSTLTAFVCWPLYHLILETYHLEYLQFIVFIIVVAALVQFVEMIIERTSDRLYVNLGIFLPLITVNCAVLGVCLFMVVRKYSYTQSIGYGLGAGAGWFLAAMAMAGIREKLKFAKIPPALQGPGSTIIIAGLMSMAFMGFAGMLAVQ